MKAPKRSRSRASRARRHATGCESDFHLSLPERIRIDVNQLEQVTTITGAGRVPIYVIFPEGWIDCENRTFDEVMAEIVATWQLHDDVCPGKLLTALVWELGVADGTARRATCCRCGQTVYASLTNGERYFTPGEMN